LPGGFPNRYGYNRLTLRYLLPRHFLSLALALLAIGLLSASAAAQARSATQTLVVMPFENQSSAPGLEWIGEAFPEILSQRMGSSHLYVMGREERATAFDRSGIPSTVLPSRATLYQIAEQMGADYMVMGSYNFDGNTFTATAQLLDLKKLHLYPAVESSGPLTSLINLQTILAWQLLQQLPAHPSMTREQFLSTWPPVRLDAFENYIRGILATDHQQRIHHLHEAVKLNPNYSAAMFELGKTYFDSHEYESAASWFARIPKTEDEAGEANFLLGLSEFYLGNYDKAYSAFNYVVTRVPLTEVYNNLGVVEARRGHRASAIEYFSKAVNADPSDTDYHFNLAVALYRNGDSAGAARQLREELQQRPSDGEAKSLLDAINRGVPPPAPSAAATPGNALLPASQPRVPLERIKRNYDEASYQQLELEIQNLTEARLAKMSSRDHSAYHLQRGKEMLAQSMATQAESEFRDAISADPGNAAAHAQLAILLEEKGDVSNARTEAQTSIRLKPNVDALLVLARLDLKQGQPQTAETEVQRALALEPANSAALALKRDIAARQTGAK